MLQNQIVHGWHVKSSLSTYAWDFCAIATTCRHTALLGGNLYLFGGLNAGPSKSMWVLNVRERRWRPIATKNGTSPAPRQGHTMCCEYLHMLRYSHSTRIDRTLASGHVFINFPCCINNRCLPLSAADSPHRIRLSYTDPPRPCAGRAPLNTGILEGIVCGGILAMLQHGIVMKLARVLALGLRCIVLLIQGTVGRRCGFLEDKAPTRLAPTRPARTRV